MLQIPVISLGTTDDLEHYCYNRTLHSFTDLRAGETA